MFAERKGFHGFGASRYHRAVADLGKVADSIWDLSMNLLIAMGIIS